MNSAEANLKLGECQVRMEAAQERYDAALKAKKAVKNSDLRDMMLAQLASDVSAAQKIFALNAEAAVAEMIPQADQQLAAAQKSADSWRTVAAGIPVLRQRATEWEQQAAYHRV